MGDPGLTGHVCRALDASWQLVDGARGQCPAGTVFELPRHAKENTALQHALQHAALPQAWLPLQGEPLEITRALPCTFEHRTLVRSQLCQDRLMQAQFVLSVYAELMGMRVQDLNGAFRRWGEVPCE